MYSTGNPSAGRIWFAVTTVVANEVCLVKRILKNTNTPFKRGSIHGAKFSKHDANVSNIHVHDVCSKFALCLLHRVNGVLLCPSLSWGLGLVDNALDPISEVTPRRARLVPGWATDRLRAGKPPQYVTSHPGQLSLAIPPGVGAVSTSECWGVNRHTARCISFIFLVCSVK